MLFRSLGVYANDQWYDWKIRKGKAWASLLSLKAVWKSEATIDCKRDLFYALIEPILSYGMIAWPLTLRFQDAVDATFSRMLRFALGLDPACVSRLEWPTESLYGRDPSSPPLLKPDEFHTLHIASGPSLEISLSISSLIFSSDRKSTRLNSSH